MPGGMAARAANGLRMLGDRTPYMECAEHQGAVTLHALATSPVAKVELCSIKQLERDMR